MAPNGTHYEQAFESLLQQRQVPYVAVDQAKKALFGPVRLKSFDFIIYPPRGPRILTDVKGRKLSRKSFQRGRLGQTWTTLDDVESLRRWQRVFGAGYLAAFVFAYWLCDDDPDDHPDPNSTAPPPADPPGSIATFEQRDYTFVVAELNAYQRQMRPRSSSWQTVYVPARPFARCARPFDQLLPTSR